MKYYTDMKNKSAEYSQALLKSQKKRNAEFMNKFGASKKMH